MVALAVTWRAFIYRFARNDFGLSTRFTFGVLDSFAIGILLFVVSNLYDPWLRERKNTCRLICLGGLLLITLIYFGSFALEGTNLVFAPTLISMGVFGFLLGGRHLPLLESPFLRCLSWPGKYCYGNYLFHGAVLYLLHPVLVSSIPR